MSKNPVETAKRDSPDVPARRKKRRAQPKLCGICGQPIAKKHFLDETAIYSRHTKKHYHPITQRARCLSVKSKNGRRTGGEPANP